MRALRRDRRPFDHAGARVARLRLVVGDRLGQQLGHAIDRDVDVDRRCERVTITGEPAADQYRYESDGCDVFARNRLLKGIGKLGLANVLEINRTRIFFVPVPWRMAFDSLPVPVRQVPPSDKTHHVAVVKQENGGALAGERGEDGIQAGVVNARK